MAEVTTKYSPMHIDCTVGYPYGVEDSGYSCGYHTRVRLSRNWNRGK